MSSNLQSNVTDFSRAYRRLRKLTNNNVDESMLVKLAFSLADLTVLQEELRQKVEAERTQSVLDEKVLEFLKTKSKLDR